MDRLKQIETFVAVASRGSLTAAANAEGVAPAIIGRRIDGLEARLGVKLLVRTTRRITLTHEGVSFLEDCQRLLADLQSAEASVTAGGVKASGHLRITAPAGFGRKHVAPLVPAFRERNPDVTLSLDLTDRLVDLVNEGYDCAVRVGALADSSLIGVRLGESRRACVASAAYIGRHGAPHTPQDLARHRCLAYSSVASQPRGWVFQIDGELQHLRVSGPLDCTDGAVLHQWCLEGHGLAWRSMWEVGEDLAAGRLVEVLADFCAPPVGIHAVFAQRKHMPLRLRLWVDYLKDCFADPTLWPWSAAAQGSTTPGTRVSG
jgi:DNA-binding transcriptional LysR family regulator